MMEQTAPDGHRIFHLRILSPGDGADPPFGGDPRPALVWAARGTAVDGTHRLCASTIASGCRYVRRGGRECRAWEAVADEALTAHDLTGPGFHERMAMTSSFPGVIRRTKPRSIPCTPPVPVRTPTPVISC